jgi:hypothetical protein
MKAPLALATLLCSLSFGTFAAHCPADMKAIDEALSTQSSLTTAQLDEVRQLRAEGEAQHKAGNHKGSMESLGKARKMLGI